MSEPSAPLSGDDASRVSESIARVAGSGLPLGPGLRAASLELPRGRARRALDDIAHAVDRGASLEEAVNGLGSRVPEHLKGILAVGSRSGRLGETLSRFLGFVNVGDQIRSALSVSLIYPIFAVALAVGVFVFVCVTVVSSFEQIFSDFGIPIPGITVVMIAVSRVFVKAWRGLLELAIGITLLALVARFALGRSARRSLASAIPVIGTVWRNTSMAEFCHLLALMIESEMPLAPSLRMAGDGVGDARFRRAGRAMESDVAGGLSLSQAVLRQKTFPRGLARLLRWAEGHQGLPDSLRMAGQMFEARARAQAKFAGTVLAVLAIIATILGISAVIVGVMVPLLRLISRLSG